MTGFQKQITVIQRGSIAARRPKLPIRLNTTSSIITVSFVLFLPFLALAKGSPFQLAEVIREADAGSGFVRESVTTYTWTDRKLARVTIDFDLDRDGTNDSRSTIAYTYDSNGTRLAGTSESFSTAEQSLNAHGTTTYEYDDKGNLFRATIKRDSGPDGTIDFISQTTLTYDDRGNLLQRVILTDMDADGTWDQGTTFTRTYDRHGNLLTETRQSDGNLDGIIDFVMTTRNTPDRAGNAVLVVTEIDYDADGVVDETGRRASTFDKQGNVLSSTNEAYDLDGMLVFTSTSNYSYGYDPYGNPLQVTTSSDTDGDGVIDFTERTTYRYTRVTGQP